VLGDFEDNCQDPQFSLLDKASRYFCVDVNLNLLESERGRTKRRVTLRSGSMDNRGQSPERHGSALTARAARIGATE
jgi:hypothetical protein